jgi:hypothetical protein
MRTLLLFTIVCALAVTGRRADAYPQFQVRGDTTCTGCHIAPAGGGPLNENGRVFAESISTYGTSPEFLNGAFETPDWLTLGGDFRSLAGFFASPQRYLLAVPMQADLYAHATRGQFGAQLTLGYRPPQDGNRATTSLWAREHYITWQSDPGERTGLYVRLGHFMPVFGLRIVEHPTYVRRFGGTPLFAETYAAAVEMVDDRFEGHVTGFIKDPLMDPVVDATGAAVYGEYQVGGQTRVGGGGMLQQFDWQRIWRAEVTGKHFLPSAKVLVQGELQFMYSQIAGEGTSHDFGVKGIVGYLMGSYQPIDSIMIDLGLSHYDPNLRVTGLDRDCIDLNVHWFVTSHVEAMLVNRFELVGWNWEGDQMSGWTMLQAHYRL